jgi:hypothetical protein
VTTTSDELSLLRVSIYGDEAPVAGVYSLLVYAKDSGTLTKVDGSSNTATLYKGNEVVKEGIAVSPSSNAVTLSITPMNSHPVCAAGTYTLTIPANTLVANGETVDKDWSVSFTIAPQHSTEGIVVTPAAGAVFDENASAVTIDLSKVNFETYQLGATYSMEMGYIACVLSKNEQGVYNQSRKTWYKSNLKYDAETKVLTLPLSDGWKSDWEEYLDSKTDPLLLKIYPGCLKLDGQWIEPIEYEFYLNAPSTDNSGETEEPVVAGWNLLTSNPDLSSENGTDLSEWSYGASRIELVLEGMVTVNPEYVASMYSGPTLCKGDDYEDVAYLSAAQVTVEDAYANVSTDPMPLDDLDDDDNMGVGETWSATRVILDFTKGDYDPEANMVEADSYGLIIPQQFFLVNGVVPTELTGRQPLRYAFTITGEATGETAGYNTVYVDSPKEGAVKCDSFSIYVPEMGNATEADNTKVTTITKDGVACNSTVTWSVDPKWGDITATVEPAIEGAGEYVVTLPAGTFVLTEGVSKEFSFTFTLDEYVAKDVEFSPANGSTVSRLDYVTVTSKATFNNSLYDTADLWVYLQKDGANYVNEIDGSNYSAHVEVVKIDDNTAHIFFYKKGMWNSSYTGYAYDPLEEAGVYTFTLPAGTFVFADGESLDEIEFTYTVVPETSGVDSVAAANSELVDVYSIDGVCVLRGAEKSNVSSLAPGVYLVNGKKVLVRK